MTCICVLTAFCPSFPHLETLKKILENSTLSRYVKKKKKKPTDRPNFQILVGWGQHNNFFFGLTFFSAWFLSHIIGLMESMRQADSKNWSLQPEQFADLAASLSNFFQQTGVSGLLNSSQSSSGGGRLLHVYCAWKTKNYLKQKSGGGVKIKIIGKILFKKMEELKLVNCSTNVKQKHIDYIIIFAFHRRKWTQNQNTEPSDQEFLP